MKPKLMLAVTVFLTGCAVKIPEWPNIDDATSEYAVAAGYFVSGTYLPENPECFAEQPDGTIILCIDPPPMALRFEVSDLLFGPKIPTRVVTFTTSHYGKSGIRFGQDRPYLLLLISNGEDFVTPRYHMRPLAWDSRDRLAVPLESPTDSVWWLPCGVSQPAKSIRLVGPRDAIRIELGYLSKDELREMGDYVRVHGATATIRRGVYLDEIERRMKGASKEQIDAGCDLSSILWPESAPRAVDPR